jgi:hypothetical protein|tara:strand:- start:5567 stop:5725 length:159 start_codon:yes stop_codon:yes gene_type:complete
LPANPRIAYGLVFNDVIFAFAILGALIGTIGVYAWSFGPLNDPAFAESQSNH